MNIKAFAKINLCLDVTGKRDDGYHTLKSVMQTVSLCDDITVEKLDNGIVVDCSDKALSGQDNLVYKTAQLFFEKTGTLGGVKIFINKNIPVCGGLGGGSADAAAVLKALNILFETNLSVQELCNIGVLLGADVPFCIVGGTCLAEGIGEQLTELKAMPDCYILIAKKGVKSSTKDMYKKLDAKPFSIKSDYDSIISNLEKGDLKRVCQHLSNSFESVCEQENLQVAKAKMYECNALYSGLSGAGPTVFGIFSTEQDCKNAERLLLNQDFNAYICKLSKK
jgi:4-diphosphocytidyl-2-C-methyl-D-erythritol kinase